MNTQPKITQEEEVLIEKIRTLTPDRVSEVEDFIDFLQHKSADKNLIQAASRLSENAFNKVWDNPEDAEYDRL